MNKKLLIISALFIIAAVILFFVAFISGPTFSVDGTNYTISNPSRMDYRLLSILIILGAVFFIGSFKVGDNEHTYKYKGGPAGTFRKGIGDSIANTSITNKKVILDKESAEDKLIRLEKTKKMFEDLGDKKSTKHYEKLIEKTKGSNKE